MFSTRVRVRSSASCPPTSSSRDHADALACSSSSLMTTPAGELFQPSLAIPHSARFAHYDCPPSPTSLLAATPIDLALCHDLPHQEKAYELAYELANRAVSLDVQRRSLDLALQAHHNVHGRRRGSSAAKVPGAPRRGPVHFKRTVVAPRSNAAMYTSASAPSLVSPPPPPRPVTPPTMAGGRVVAGFTPLPDLITVANVTPPPAPPVTHPFSFADGRKSPEGLDTMEVDDEDDALDHNVVVQVYESQQQEMHYYDVTVPMRRLTGGDDDEDY